MMAKKGKTLSVKVMELSDRLKKIEEALGHKIKPLPNHDDLNDHHPFCCLPEVPERIFDDDVSDSRERLIRYIDKKWVNGTKLRYFFFKEGLFSGDATHEQLVRDAFKIWEDVGIGITFEEINTITEAEIRIGFHRDGRSWSYVGRDVIDIPGQMERTMNFGWDLTLDPRGVDTPVHEIGHTLGFPHEHQNPISGIIWDEDAVYDYFGGPPNNWSPENTYHNVLRKIPQSFVEGSSWDPNSIMHYSFAPGLIRNPLEYANGLQPNLGLSQFDIEEVRKFYPPIPESQYAKLEPFDFEMLSLEPAEQKNYIVEPDASGNYTIQSFGNSDTLMVLFEEVNGELKFLAGDDDSGTNFNAQITQRLYPSRKYVLRIRLFLNYASGNTGLLMW